MLEPPVRTFSPKFFKRSLDQVYGENIPTIYAKNM